METVYACGLVSGKYNALKQNQSNGNFLKDHVDAQFIYYKNQVGLLVESFY